jgi:intron-binding protein aquarius
MILNLQFRENVAAWVCFYDRKELFKAFLERVLRLKEVCLLFLHTAILIRAL